MPDPTSTAAPQVFFIHVMKTGGLTLFESIRASFASDEVYPEPGVDFSPDVDRPIAFRHLTMRYLETLSDERRRRIRVFTGHFPYVAREVLGGDLSTVTILREPVERTISLLRQFQRTAIGRSRADGVPLAGLSLEEVYDQPQVYEPLVHNHQTKLFCMSSADQPTGYMQEIDVDESRLALAKENLARIDVLGLTERYDDFLDEVSRRLGWSVNRDVRVNVAPSDDGSPVSKDLRRRIAADNAIDIAFYEYAKELVEARR